jgi:hypothetical protein
MTVADVNGVKLAGLLIDAGTTNSAVLAEIGPAGSSADHSANPTSLHDVFFRVGGAGVGKATVSLRINSNNVIGDHMWIWRADHGSGVGWTSNTGANGLVVNGANVTAYGLFVEHYQQFQVIWNGNGGRTYFFQNEIPYDVPNQSVGAAGRRSGLGGVQGRRVGHHPRGVGAGQLLLLQHQSQRRARPLVRGAERGGSALPQHGDRVARRHRHHQPRHQQQRRAVELLDQRRQPRELPVTASESGPPPNARGRAARAIALR